MKHTHTKQHTGIVIGIIAVFLVAVVGLAVAFATQTQNQSPQTTEQSISQFATLKGDAFDEAYLADMLAHHEGAVNMSEMIGPGTERKELRDFGFEIISTQSQEMIQMQQWQQEWGYDSTYAGHASHGGDSGNEMAGHMMEMSEALDGLTGPAFEKRFLELMIEHHQQAVDMSIYAEENAKHQEIKDLAASIITTQNSEIEVMERWLSAWGYSSI